MQIRLATPGDAGWMSTLARDHVERGLGWSWRPARITTRILDPDSVAIVAGTAGTAAGFAMMRFGPTSAHLDLLCVAPAWRRQSVATRLLGWLHDSARVAGTFLVHLEVREGNQEARDFYRAVGYRTLARLPGYYRRREAALRLYRDLAVRRNPPAWVDPWPRDA